MVGVGAGQAGLSVAEALRAGALAGAGLDVYAREPVDPAAEILSAPNVVGLPHVAWLTRETLDRSLAAAADNIARLRDGRPLNDRHV